MSKECNTPVDFWLRLPLRDFVHWIEEHNALVKEENERIKHQNKRRHR